MQLFQGTSLCQPIFGGNTSSHTLNIVGDDIPIFLYRYFMIKIFSIHDMNYYKLQFSKLQFIDKNGNPFIYPSDITASHNDVVEDIYPGEGLLQAVINDPPSDFPKACMRFSPIKINEKPLKIIYDLQSDCLNLISFSRWHWYTSRDTQEEGRNMRTFKLLVSNIGDIDDDSCWKEIDYVVDNCDLRENRKLAYERKTPFVL